MLAEDIRHPEKQIIVFKKKAGKNIKDEKRDKGGREGAPSQEGNLRREVSKHQETLSLPSLWRALEAQRAT